MKVGIIYITLLAFNVCIASGQGIKKSHHDFTGTQWNGDQSCTPCHFLSVSSTDSSNAPLWYLQKKAPAFIVFSKYRSNKIFGQPLGNSKLCLSCHDGTIAAEKHVTAKKITIEPETGLLSFSSSDEHPISIPYRLSGSLLHNPIATKSGLGGSIAQDLLENGEMECTSCHDVHVSRNREGCIGCHKNGLFSKQETIPLSL